MSAPALALPARRSGDSFRRRASDFDRDGQTPLDVTSDAAAASTAPRLVATTQKDRAAFFELHVHPLLIVDRNGRTLDANAAARADIRAGRLALFANGVIRFGGRECARRFQAALADLDVESPLWRRLVVRMSDGEWRLSRIRLLPEVDDAVLVEIQPSIADQDTDISPLAQAFALTAAETAVLSNLLEARAPKEIARNLGISSHTVRAHMRAIYAKLGVRARSGMMKAALRLVS